MSNQPKRKAAQAPISAHPAFPAIVALWFAALLGLGALVLPVTLYERASEASGLSSLVTAAQPPLGVTARIIVALVAGGLGVFAGLAIARRVIAASLRNPAPRRAAAARAAGRTGASAFKRPISAPEELGEGGLDADADARADANADAHADEGLRHDLLPGRRRAPAITDDSPRSELSDEAPLVRHLAHRETPSAPDPEPLDLAGFAALADVDGEPAADASTIAPGPEPEPEPQLAAAGRPLSPPERALDGLAMVELVERFAHALQQHRQAAQRAADSRDTADAVVDLTSALATRDAPDTGAADELDDEPGQGEAHYPSLLAMKNSFGLARAAIRIDGQTERQAAGIEPMATPSPRPFDAPADRRATAPFVPSADSAETEKRLREALEKLQKMSGVG